MRLNPYQLVVLDLGLPDDRRSETGIGLAIVKAIVDAHGGEVSAANADAGGAVVTIKVPLATS